MSGPNLATLREAARLPGWRVKVERMAAETSEQIGRVEITLSKLYEWQSALILALREPPSEGGQ